MSHLKNDGYSAHISSLGFSSILDTFCNAKGLKNNLCNIFHKGQMCGFMERK